MKTHGDGTFSSSDFSEIGKYVVFETGVLVFHPENIEIGENVYIGHQTILKGYYKNKLTIGDGTWIGQQVFLHGAGGLSIGKHVGIAPGVKIITSTHLGNERSPIIHTPLDFKSVVIKDNSDLGIGSIILPGVTIGEGAIVGAGAVVTKDVPDMTIVAGNPARVLRKRKDPKIGNFKAKRPVAVKNER